MTVRDGEPRTAASTFTQLLNSDVLIQGQFPAGGLASGGVGVGGA